MGRPALQRLLADITAGRVDIVVVYKIDRLTRSLADFAKIVEILDAKGASFVDIGKHWPELPVARKRAVLAALIIKRIEVRFDQIDIHLHPLRLCALLDLPATPSQGVNDDEIELLSGGLQARVPGAYLQPEMQADHRVTPGDDQD